MPERLRSLVQKIRSRFAGSPRHKTLREELIETMDTYDMIDDADEQFFFAVYWHFISQTLDQYARGRKLKVLDAGCGQGRFAIPLVRKGYDVTGIEISPQIADFARTYAAQNNLPLLIINGEVGDVVQTLPPGSFDGIFCIEVIYLVEHYDKLIADLSKLLKKGGLLFITFRPKLYYMGFFLQRKNFDEPARLMERGCTVIQDGRLNCQWSEDMDALVKKHGFSEIRTHGIGIVSGIEGDPQACIALPSKLSPAERERLFALEIGLSDQCPDAARYVLLTAIKQ